MKTFRTGAMMFVASAIASVSMSAHAGPKIKLEQVASALNSPLVMAQPPGDERMFIAEQYGRIRILADGKVSPTPFLDIRSKIVNQHHDFDERGLLGLAFHPKFKENGKFYVAYSAKLDFQSDLGQMLWYSHSNVVEEYTVAKDDPDAADPSSARRIMSSPWPQFNHNGHWIGFGKDGMLYVSMGDGGYANDWGIGHNVTEGNGQDMTTNLGKILRIDVDSRTDGKPYGIPNDNPFVGDASANPEIWAYGLRNPWRCSFDMNNDDLYCADLGQNSIEEVNLIAKGANLGWRKMEGSLCFDYTKPDDHPATCDQAGLTLPIMEYKNCSAKPDGCKGISITGGYIYRGQHADWNGKYIFGDWSKTFSEMDGQFFVGSKGADGKWTMEIAEVAGMDGKKPYVLAFAQDSAGEVYALTSITTGPNGSLDSIYKIVPAQ